MALIILGVLLSIAAPMKLVKTEMFGGEEDRRLRLFYHINGTYTVEKVEEAVDVYEKYLFDNQDRFEIESVYSYYQGDFASSTILLRKGKGADKSVSDIQKEIRDSLPKLAIANPSFDWRNDSGDVQDAIEVRLKGESSEQLLALSQDVAWTLSQIPGLVDVRSEAQAGVEEVHVVVDRERAKVYGFSTAEVANVVSAAMRGINLRRFRTPEGEIEMRLEFDEKDRRSVEDLRNVPLIGRSGEPLKLASIADFTIRRGPQAISRQNRVTSMAVTMKLSGITSSEARKKISSMFSRIDLPAGYSWSFGERHNDENEAMRTMLVNLLLALALIYFVMAALFESLLFPAAIWTQIIFSVVGVYWFYLMTGTKMSIMGMIGILILIGVVVNNGIVLVDHINQLRLRGLSRADAIIQAGRDRMRPILMTAGTTCLSLVPLCIVKTEIGGTGGPPYYPMARAIVGGLAFSTIITLLILPTIYCGLDNLRNWSKRVSGMAR